MYIFLSIHQVPSRGCVFIQTCCDIQSYESAALLAMNLVKNPLVSSGQTLDSIKVLGTIPNEDIIEVFV